MSICSSRPAMAVAKRPKDAATVVTAETALALWRISFRRENIWKPNDSVAGPSMYRRRLPGAARAGAPGRRSGEGCVGRDGRSARGP